MLDNISNNTTVLVVDDNPLIVDQLQSTFKTNGYNVVTSCSAQNAMQILKSEPIDVIVCDVMMPEVDGFKLLRSVRETPELERIPFIFLSALDDDDERSKGINAGADDYLNKPINTRRVITTIKSRVARSKQQQRQTDLYLEKYKERILRTLSHEFRTPLVAISTGTEILMEHEQEGNDKKAVDLLKAIHSSGLRLENLVNNFMLLQQIEAGVADQIYDQDKEMYRFEDFFQGFYNKSIERLKELNFTYQQEYVIGNKELKVFICKDQIIDVLDRILDNAIKFSAEEKDITISCTEKLDTVTIEIKDRGIGIVPQKINEAISLFGQINRQTYEQQGGGLGLAIAYRYALINKCRLHFTQRKTGGSIVSLILQKYV